MDVRLPDEFAAAPEKLIVEANGLSYSGDNGQAILSEVSLTIRSGETVAIAGPNGAGKSTLARILAGIERPTSGEIRLGAVPISSISSAERSRRIAYVGQLSEPDRRLSVRDYVGLGRIPHAGLSSAAKDIAVVTEVLERTGLQRLADGPLKWLSGGELQRASIARALAQEAELLILDEPTNHLDARAKGEVLSLVASLGIACLCVLHELTLIPQFADRTLLLNEGHPAAFGATAVVLTKEIVSDVFGVDMLILQHPTENRDLSVLDIPFPKFLPTTGT